MLTSSVILAVIIIFTCCKKQLQILILTRNMQNMVRDCTGQHYESHLWKIRISLLRTIHGIFYYYFCNNLTIFITEHTPRSNSLVRKVLLSNAYYEHISPNCFSHIDHYKYIRQRYHLKQIINKVDEWNVIEGISHLPHSGTSQLGGSRK